MLGFASSWCLRRRASSQGAFILLHVQKKCSSILHRLLASSVPGGFPGHLHISSRARCIPSSCVFSWCLRCWASSQGIFILLRVPKKSPSLASSLGVVGTRWLPRSSSSFFMCKKCPSILHHLWVSLAPSQSISMLRRCQPPSSILHHPLLVSSALSVLPGHLCAHTGTGHLLPSCTIF